MEPIFSIRFSPELNLTPVMLEEIDQGITVKKGAEHLYGKTFYHGTEDLHASSLTIEGPGVGLGKGLGDEGIYLTDHLDLAEQYASGPNPRVLKGRLNPNKSYVVGRTVINVHRPVNLIKGEWPHNWYKNVLLKQFVNKHFDILEFRVGTSTQVGPHPIIVVKSKAGPDAIII